MSEIYEIADAVKAALQTASFNPASGSPAVRLFTPQRLYVPLTKVTALERLTVLVIATADDVSKFARDSAAEDIKIDVGVLKKLDAGVDGTEEADNAVIDPLIQLSRGIALMYGSGQKAGSASWIASKYPLMFDPERMRTEHVFQAVINFTFKQAP